MSTSTARFDALDGLKGIFILLMVKSHFYDLFPQSRFVLPYHWIGFSDTSQGFVFVSGIVLGLVLTKRFDRQGSDAVAAYIRSRLWLIYGYHIAMVIVATLCLAVISHLQNGPQTFSWVESTMNFVLGAVLIHMPPFVGILPLYILLVAATPLIMHLLWSGRTLTVLGLSLVLWFAAPLSPIQLWGIAFTEVLQTYGIHGRYVLFFNVLAWQSFYVAGLFIGFQLARGRFRFAFFRSRTGRELAVIAGACALLTVILKNLVYAPSGQIRSIYYAINGTLPKENGTIQVVIGFASLAYLVAWLHLGAGSSTSAFVQRAGRTMRRITTWTPFVRVGQSAIECLAVHVIWYYAAITWIAAVDPGPVPRALAFTMGFVVLFAIVTLKSRRAGPSTMIARGAT